MSLLLLPVCQLVSLFSSLFLVAFYLVVLFGQFGFSGLRLVNKVIIVWFNDTFICDTSCPLWESFVYKCRKTFNAINLNMMRPHVKNPKHYGCYQQYNQKKLLLYNFLVLLLLPSSTHNSFFLWISLGCNSCALLQQYEYIFTFKQIFSCACDRPNLIFCDKLNRKQKRC